MPVPAGFSRPLTPTKTAELLGELLADPDSWTDGELADGLIALDRLHSQVEAAQAVVGARFDGRTVWAGDGARSGAAWLASRGEQSRAGAGALFTRGRDLRCCPAVTEAYRQGLIGTAKVTMLLRVRRGVEGLFAEHEAELVEHVRRLTIEHARIVLRRWRILATGDDGTREPPETADSIHLTPTFEGRWDLAGNLDPESGKLLANAIEAEVDAMFRRGEASSGDGLTPAQRSARALVHLAVRGLTGGTRRGEPVPLVHVIADEATLHGHPLDEVAELDWRRCDSTGFGGGPLPRSTVERYICQGHTARITVRRRPDGGHTVLDASPATRIASRRQRRALRERDRGCVFPGCVAPPERCDAHHVHPYEAGGPTVLANLVLVCSFHHHRVHEGGFLLSRPGGRVVVECPDGSRLTATPHGHQVDLGPHPQDLPPTGPGDPPPRARPPSRFRPLAERLREQEIRDRFDRHLIRQRLIREGMIPAA